MVEGRGQINELFEPHANRGYIRQLGRVQSGAIRSCCPLTQVSKAAFSNYTLKAWEVRTMQRTVKDLLTLQLGKNGED